MDDTTPLPADVPAPVPAPADEGVPAPSPQAAPADSSEKSVFSENSDNATASWTDALPDELKSAPALKKFKSANDALKSYVGLCSLAGKKGLMPPAEGADQTEIDAYLAARRGGVDSPEAYSLPYEAVKPFGMTQEVYKLANRDFFAAGLSDREQQQVMRTYARFIEYERAEWIRENNAACEQALMQARHAWGMQYDEKLASVRQLMKSFPEVKKALEATGAQNNFAVLDLLATFAASAAEGGRPGQDGKPVADANALDKQIDALVKSAAYNDMTSPGHKAAMDQFWKLMAEKQRMADNR